MIPLVECVPNFSEGRRPEVVEELVREIAGVPEALVLDRHCDPDHHRSVITFAGPPDAVVEAAIRAAGCAAARIDLRRHQGVHPRIGAADVIPFVPLAGLTIEECVPLAERAGAEIWRRFQIPVYFYGAAARAPERKRLENLRRGGFESLREEVLRNPARRPDVGGPALHPTAGATAVGVRPFLIAFNVVLATADVEAARRIARRVRESSGGLPAVKALGVLLQDPPRAQVTMNLTNFEVTPVHAAYAAVEREAAAAGILIASRELVGLVPRRACEVSRSLFDKVENFHPDCILENRLAALSGRTSPGSL